MDSSVNTAPPTDQETELIDRIVAGNPKSFEILVENYQQRIYATLLGVLGNRHDAEDTTQETFLTAFRKLDQFERRSSFYTWLHRIAFHLAIDLQRRKKRSKIVYSNTDAMEPHRSSDRSSERSSQSPEAIAITNEAICQVQSALSKLHVEGRNIIVLRDVQGLDYSEIATLLEIPIGTVRSRLHRARLELREIMNEKGVNP